MDKAYIDRKIEKCKNLVETATSDAQKKIYQGYLDFWTKKLPKPVEEIIDYALVEMFEIDNAPKQAYYNRYGTQHKTKAFKEYLNQRTQ